MSEGMSIEIAAMLAEGHSKAHSRVWLIEVGEALMLSAIAVAL